MGPPSALSVRAASTPTSMRMGPMSRTVPLPPSRHRRVALAPTLGSLPWMAREGVGLVAVLPAARSSNVSVVEIYTRYSVTSTRLRMKVGCCYCGGGGDGVFCVERVLCGGCGGASNCRMFCWCLTCLCCWRLCSCWLQRRYCC